MFTVPSLSAVPRWRPLRRSSQAGSCVSHLGVDVPTRHLPPEAPLRSITALPTQLLASPHTTGLLPRQSSHTKCFKRGVSSLSFPARTPAPNQGDLSSSENVLKQAFQLRPLSGSTHKYQTAHKQPVVCQLFSGTGVNKQTGPVPGPRGRQAARSGVGRGVGLPAFLPSPYLPGSHHQPTVPSATRMKGAVIHS